MLLLSAAIVGGSLAFRPASRAECSIAADDKAPEPQSHEESTDESAEHEESELSKPAALGSALMVERPAARVGTLRDCPTRLTPGAGLRTAPIRGPPCKA